MLGVFFLVVGRGEGRFVLGENLLAGKIFLLGVWRDFCLEDDVFT